jgi:DNA processing protein
VPHNLDREGSGCHIPAEETLVPQPLAIPVKAAEDRALLWLALALTPGLGPTRARRIVGNMDAVFHASLTELEATGILASSAQSLGTGKSLELAQEESVRAVAAGGQIISLDDPAYPSQLKEIYDPPLILYLRGAVDMLSQPGIAVIGTRHPTPYGIGMAEWLACDLARQPLVTNKNSWGPNTLIKPRR